MLSSRDKEIAKHPTKYRKPYRCLKCGQFLTLGRICNKCGIIWIVQISRTGRTILWTESEHFEVVEP